jgi:hypothetical protein
MSFLLNNFEVELLQHCEGLTEIILAIEKEIASGSPPKNLLDLFFLQAENKDSHSLMLAVWSEAQKALRQTIKEQLLQTTKNISDFYEE